MGASDEVQYQYTSTLAEWGELVREYDDDGTDYYGIVAQ